MTAMLNPPHPGETVRYDFAWGQRPHGHEAARLLGCSAPRPVAGC